jgi:hypothetical protein
MALKETQDDDPLVNQNRHRTQSLFLSTWMATPKSTKRNHVHMTPPMEKDMKRMIAIPLLMAMIEAVITTITIVTLPLPFETSNRLTHMSLHLILIVITITITITTIKLQSPILFLLLVLQHGILLILKRQLIYLIDSMRKAVNCRKREMIRLPTQLTTCCRTSFQLGDKSVQRTGCGNLLSDVYDLIFSCVTMFYIAVPLLNGDLFTAALMMYALWRL